jgi:hypothetical protein
MKRALEDDLACETGDGAKAAALPTIRREIADENFIVRIAIGCMN